MGILTNENILAIRTNNIYSRNNNQMNTVLRRVATGMKVISAKDAPSTWAISEKMRERIRANDQANQNIQNDTALIKTAQGGISNTIDILKTIKERAINAANDSNMDSDRARIATEVKELLKQIDTNASSVKFNGRTLLKGDLADDTKTPSHPVLPLTAWKLSDGTFADMNTQIKDIHIQLRNGSIFHFTNDMDDEITFTWKQDGINKTSAPININSTIQQLADSLENDGLHLRYFGNDTEISYGTNSVTVGNNILKTDATNGAGFYLIGNKGKTITEFKLEYTSNSTGGYLIWSNESSATSSGLRFQIGGEKDFNMQVTLSDMTSKTLLGMDTGSFANLFLDKTTAQTAITKIDTALTTTLEEATKLGSIENRLGYAADNITTMNENLEATDSTLRDADIAKEMTDYMKFTVLSRASQYMMTQANQNHYSVLNLIQ